MKKMALKYILLTLVLLLIIDVISKLLSTSVLSSTDFNNFVTPIAAITAAIVYLFTLIEIRKQNSVLVNANRIQNFLTNFYTLLNILKNVKESFTYNNKFGIEGFQEFRREFDFFKERAASEDDVYKMIDTLFYRSGPAITRFPIRIIFEMINMVLRQDEKTKETYRVIFFSTITENESIYIYNFIHSGLLMIDEIPDNFEKFVRVFDRNKLFVFVKDKLSINQIAFPNLRKD